jgi:signal transduction histidine kinase/ActR/RegA family two-component response regulator
MQYVVAILIVGAAAVLTGLLWPTIATAPAVFFLVAVGISAWIGGMGPGLMATGASFAAIAGLILLLGDLRNLGGVEVLRILSLLPIALFIGLLHARKSRAEQALRERDARLQLVSEQIPGSLWSTDTDLSVTSGFGAQAELLHGGAGSTLFEHFNTQDTSFAPIAAHRRALRGESSSYELKWAGRTFQSHVEPLRDISGEIIGVVGVATDITDRKFAEEERERLVAALESQKLQLEAANHAKDRFLAMLSHELRTPLTPVLALTSSLAERSDLPAELQEDLETIRRNVELEATLIDDLLDVTRIARGKLQLNLQEVDAHDLIRNAVGICLPDGRAKQIDVELELCAGARFVRGDAARLQQAFWNLIKNAIKFTPVGGRVRVSSTDLASERLRVEVSDTGIGITPELLPHIFDAFEQGAPAITQQFGGLGLGLAISKALVEAHGGEIAARSDGEGRGACFSIELETVHSVETAGAAPGAAKRANGHALKILVVEDHADTARVMQRLLRESGHEVATAASMSAALRVLEEAVVDLVISDLGLPDGSGLDLMREIGREHRVKGIALSGYGTEDDVQRSLAAGFAAHLTKPVTIAALRQAIGRVAAESAVK